MFWWCYKSCYIGRPALWELLRAGEATQLQCHVYQKFPNRFNTKTEDLDSRFALRSANSCPVTCFVNNWDDSNLDGCLMVIHASHRKHTEKMPVLVVTYASYRKHTQKRCPCTLAFVPPQLIKLSIPATICVFKRLSSGKWRRVVPIVLRWPRHPVARMSRLDSWQRLCVYSSLLSDTLSLLFIIILWL